MARTREEILRMMEEQKSHKQQAENIIRHTSSEVAIKGAYGVISNVEYNLEMLQKKLDAFDGNQIEGDKPWR